MLSLFLRTHSLRLSEVSYCAFDSLRAVTISSNEVALAGSKDAALPQLGLPRPSRYLRSQAAKLQIFFALRVTLRGRTDASTGSSQIKYRGTYSCYSWRLPLSSHGRTISVPKDVSKAEYGDRQKYDRFDQQAI